MPLPSERTLKRQRERGAVACGFRELYRQQELWDRQLERRLHCKQQCEQQRQQERERKA